MPFSKTTTHSDGGRTEKWVIAQGVSHCEDGPAEIGYDASGRVKSERWYRNGDTHRLDGPANIDYSVDGRVFRESWSDRGKLSRIDGPAWTSYDRNGEVDRSEFYLYGKGYASHQAIGAELLTHSDHALARELARSPYSSLLDAGVEPRTVAYAIYDGVSTPEGIAAYLEGAPAEWARAFEDGRA